LSLSDIDLMNRIRPEMELAATRSGVSVTAPTDRTSPADEAWALLRELLFAERRRFLDTASEFELHPAQAGALLQLDQESGSPMHEIAAHLACDSSNVTGIVDRLEARGLVMRRAGERDRRVKYIVPTPLGLEVRDAMRARMARAPAAIERLSPKEQRLLRDLLARAARGPQEAELH
jgi:DNA-binding MarR family transcriptional regulator